MPIDLLTQFEALSVDPFPAFHQICFRMQGEPTRNVDQLQREQDRRSCGRMNGGDTSVLPSDFFKGDFLAGIAKTLLLVTRKLEHSSFRRALEEVVEFVPNLRVETKLKRPEARISNSFVPLAVSLPLGKKKQGSGFGVELPAGVPHKGPTS